MHVFVHTVKVTKQRKGENTVDSCCFDKNSLTKGEGGVGYLNQVKFDHKNLVTTASCHMVHLRYRIPEYFFFSC